MTTCQVQGVSYSVQHTDCEIVNNTLMWTTTPELLKITIHSEILASGITKNAYLVRISSVHTLQYANSSIFSASLARILMLQRTFLI